MVIGTPVKGSSPATCLVPLGLIYSHIDRLSGRRTENRRGFDDLRRKKDISDAIFVGGMRPAFA